MAVRPESIQVAAEMAGLPAVSEPVAAALAPDVEYELRHVLQEARKFARAAKRRRLTAGDVNNALRLARAEPLYGFSGRGGAAGAPAFAALEPGVFLLDDATVELTDLLQQPLPPCPVTPHFSLHWLAVAGEQPAIPQNPSAAERKRAAAAGGGGGGESAEAGGDAADDADGAGDQQQAADEVAGLEALSNQETILFNTITGAVTSGDEDRERIALAEVASDPGLQALLPFLSKFVYNRVLANRRNLPMLRSLMRLLRGLLQNPHLQCEALLQQMLPALLTCIVGRHLSRSATEDHWALRDLCADTVADVCRRYGADYADLQPRISRTFYDALQKKPLTTQYGAVVGIARLGPRATQQLLVPHLAAYVAKLRAVPSDNPVAHLEASMCVGAVLRAVGQLMQAPIDGVDRDALHELFGERLLPFVGGEVASVVV